VPALRCWRRTSPEETRPPRQPRDHHLGAGPAAPLLMPTGWLMSSAGDARRKRAQVALELRPAGVTVAPAFRWRLRVVDEPPLPGDEVLHLMGTAAAERTSVLASIGRSVGQVSGPPIWGLPSSLTQHRVQRLYLHRAPFSVRDTRNRKPAKLDRGAGSREWRRRISTACPSPPSADATVPSAPLSRWAWRLALAVRATRVSSRRRQRHPRRPRRPRPAIPIGSSARSPPRTVQPGPSTPEMAPSTL
jgi:hypothetical protein